MEGLSEEVIAIPTLLLLVGTVVLRHVLFKGCVAVLIEKALMDCNPVVVQIDLDGLLIVNNSYLFADMMEGDAVMMPVLA
ncbi:hypothetical protein D3C86_2069640 [compost metagenome]